MKSQFKPLGMAAAVAAATTGFAGHANAINPGNLGDLAIIPYYTTMSGYVTGVHITNTSASTQVVKLRLRRGEDSMDALDFNLIMSPYDVWTGTVKMNEDNEIFFRTTDTTCTAPGPNSTDPDNPGFQMPDPNFETLIDFRDGAEEGYIEVIGMGQAASEDSPIAIAAKHANLGGSIDNDPEPLNCTRVRDNFFRNATSGPRAGAFYDPSDRGVVASDATHQRNAVEWEEFCSGDSDPGDGDADVTVCENFFDDTPNVLSVSYFIRDGESGMEMGGNAVHVFDFAPDAMMSNQEIFDASPGAELDYYNYFYPDLDGGNGIDATRGLYDDVVRVDLGVDAILNDWSVNAANNVEVDWVVTFPGQYTMLHRNKYIASIQEGSTVECNATSTVGEGTAADPDDPYCDFRDIPAILSIREWDREEQQRIVIDPEDELVVSPAVGLTPEVPAIRLDFEVNVIEWFGPDTAGDEGVLGSQYDAQIGVGELGLFGWAYLTVSPNPGKTQKVCADKELAPDATLAEVDATCEDVDNAAVPMVGFAAWKRSFGDAARNYGRLIEHSWTVGSAPFSP